MSSTDLKISLAAVPYFWSKEVYQSFYSEIERSPVDIVYLGETVCSKRRSMSFQDWLDIAESLHQAGKQVVLSTLTLLEAESELKYLAKIINQQNDLVEANDMAAVQLASENGSKFVAGCAINIYNSRAINILYRLGMTRWCVPVELGQKAIESMIADTRSKGIEIEYQVFGRMPLAYSARCFTARHHRLVKDDCQFKCLQDEQGIRIATQEGDSFAQINGIQTQSAKVSHLLDQWQVLRDVGVDILRVVPVSAVDTINILHHLHAIMQGSDEPVTLSEQYEFCNGYWYQLEGMKNITTPAR